MPSSITHALNTEKSTVSEANYEITAYLDTSVGNEYQNLSLIADFNWWVEETDNLEPPKTGDKTNIVIWVIVAGIALLILILLWKKLKKEEKQGDK